MTLQEKLYRKEIIMKKGLILLFTLIAPTGIMLGLAAPFKVMKIKKELIKIKDPERLARMLERLDQLQENTLALKDLAREENPVAQEQIDQILDLVDKIVKKTVKTQ